MRLFITFILSCIALFVPLLHTPVWFPLVYDDQYLVKLTAAQLLFLAACVVLIVRYVRTGVARYSYSVLYLPVIIYLLAGLVSVAVSPAKPLSAEMFFRQLCYAGIFVLAANVATDEKAMKIIVSCMIASIACAAAYGAVQLLQGNEAVATIGNRNYFASILLLVIPSAAAMFIFAIKRRQFARGAALFLLAALLVGMVFAVRSRGAAAGLACASIGAIAIALFANGYRKAGLLSLAAVTASAAALSLSPFLAKELAGDVRLYLWKGACGMISEHPWRGWGIGTFFINFPAYRPVDYFLLPKAADVTYHPHNEILAVWADTGLIGALSLFSFVVMLVALVCSRGRKGGETGTLRASLCVGVAAVFLQSLVDMNLSIPSVAVMFWLSAGIVASGCVGRDSRALRIFAERRIIQNILGCGFVAVIFACGWLYVIAPAVAQVCFGEGAKARLKGDWRETISQYERGLSLVPYACDVRYKLAFAYDQAGQTDLALEAYRGVDRIAPGFARTDFNRAVILARSGKTSEAMAALKQGLSRNPYDAGALGFLAELEENTR